MIPGTLAVYEDYFPILHELAHDGLFFSHFSGHIDRIYKMHCLYGKSDFTSVFIGSEKGTFKIAGKHNLNIASNRVPTSSGNHGKPGKLQIKIPCMEKSWNLIKTEKSWNNHGIL